MKLLSLTALTACLLYTTINYASDIDNELNAPTCPQSACKPRYVVSPIIGTTIGGIIGSIAYLSTAHVIKPSWTVFVPGKDYGHTMCWPNGTINYDPQCQIFMDENNRLIKEYMGILIPVGAVLAPLTTYLHRKIYNWYIHHDDVEKQNILMQKM